MVKPEHGDDCCWWISFVEAVDNDEVDVCTCPAPPLPTEATIKRLLS